ncbi:MAG: aminotransferase class V-fold PLP-dependent enzyme [Dongiaceae bacterium]
MRAIGRFRIPPQTTEQVMATGRNFLFIPGPTNMPEAVRQALAVVQEDQRAPDVADFILPLFADLKQIFQMRDGQVFVFPASGTGGWEAAVTNTLSPGDKVLGACFGVFSELWTGLCRRYGLAVDAVEVEWGEGVPVDTYAERLRADRAHEIKAVLVTHNETAIGVTSDVAAVRRALDAANHPALLFVDGVSSIASIDFRMAEWGVDVAVAGSQKGFMLPTGLAIVAVSNKALAAMKTAKLPRSFFSFEDMLRTNRDGHFPYTPPMTLLRGLRASVDLLLSEGLPNVFRRHHRMAEGVRRGVAAWGFRLCAGAPQWHSDTVSTILTPAGIDAGLLVKHAYRRYNLSLGVGLARLAGKAFRIGHLGELNELMVLAALGGSEMALRDLGATLTPGAGVGAAAEYFRESAAPAN